MALSAMRRLLVALVCMHIGSVSVSTLLSLGLIVGGSVACGESNEGAVELDLSSVAQPILGGTLDRDHPEVMFLLDLAGAGCTGTNIRTDDNSGFLLTAAHCVTVDTRGPGVEVLDASRFVVVPGDDVSRSRVAFPAEAVAVEPGYDGTAADDDVAIVRYFFGNQAAPPTIEPLTPGDDELQIDDDLLLVGYGQTENARVTNTQRRRVARNVDGLDDEIIAFSQEDSRGACFGDSGGPGLVNVGGEERVSLVISTGFSDNEVPCVDGFTLGMRVSAYSDFIQGVLEDELGEAAVAGSAQ